MRRKAPPFFKRDCAAYVFRPPQICLTSAPPAFFRSRKLFRGLTVRRPRNFLKLIMAALEMVQPSSFGFFALTNFLEFFYWRRLMGGKT